MTVPEWFAAIVLGTALTGLPLAFVWVLWIQDIKPGLYWHLRKRNYFYLPPTKDEFRFDYKGGRVLVARGDYNYVSYTEDPARYGRSKELFVMWVRDDNVHRVIAKTSDGQSVKLTVKTLLDLPKDLFEEVMPLVLEVRQRAGLVGQIEQFNTLHTQIKDYDHVVSAFKQKKG